jgi:hypothetical protein
MEKDNSSIFIRIKMNPFIFNTREYVLQNSVARWKQDFLM